MESVELAQKKDRMKCGVSCVCVFVDVKPHCLTYPVVMNANVHVELCNNSIDLLLLVRRLLVAYVGCCLPVHYCAIAII